MHRLCPKQHDRPSHSWHMQRGINRCKDAYRWITDSKNEDIHLPITGAWHIWNLNMKLSVYSQNTHVP